MPDACGLFMSDGIKNIVEDASFLLNEKRLEGALLFALVAVAGTSRKRYPQTDVYSDRKAFVKLLNNENMGYPEEHAFNGCFKYEGKKFTAPELLYEYFRNRLIHEGSLRGIDSIIHCTNTEHEHAEQINFVSNGHHLTSGLQITSNLIERLISLVVNANENNSVFTQSEKAKYTKAQPYTAVSVLVPVEAIDGKQLNDMTKRGGRAIGLG